ncbi:MAG: hypothetical protein KKE57_00570 [Proteobacteria bacterium]|nr:hypothetical protein [Pseudomonadota bacterium]
MLISATYLCPIRGLAGLEAPEPNRLGEAAKIARGLGIAQLQLPVLEESLVAQVRAKVRFLDGLIQGLDRAAEAGMKVRMILPAQRVLGLYWAPPYLLRPLRSEKDTPVFVNGEIRTLRPLDWWGNPALMEKRIRSFRELLSAVHGHPALSGWVVLDRALEWPRPAQEAAWYFLKSLVAEVRHRDEKGPIYLGVGWSELLDPGFLKTLAHEAQGLRIGGLEEAPEGIEGSAGLAGDLRLAAYLGSLAQWLFGRPAEVEIGWGLMAQQDEPEEISASGRVLAEQGLEGVVWASLVDPEPILRRDPPWLLRPGLEQVGLLQEDLEPKRWVEDLLKEIQSSGEAGKGREFIDLSPEEYLADPRKHLSRLWGHFLRRA